MLLQEAMFMSYIKSKIRKPTVAPDLDKEEITAKYDMLVFGKEEEKLDYKYLPVVIPFLVIMYLVF